MDAPQNVWVVIDEDAPVYIACWPEHCHQHINDAIESELDGAGNMVVREYVLAAEVQRLRDAAGGVLEIVESIGRRAFTLDGWTTVQELRRALEGASDATN